MHDINLHQVGWAEVRATNWRTTTQPFPVMQQAELEKEAFRKRINDRSTPQNSVFYFHLGWLFQKAIKIVAGKNFQVSKL